MPTVTYPTYILITSPTYVVHGAVDYARELAREMGGYLRAPHHTVSPQGAASEMAIAASGVLLLEGPGDFHPRAIDPITDVWATMPLAVRPRIVVALGGGDDTGELLAATLERFVMLYGNWRVGLHLVGGIEGAPVGHVRPAGLKAE